MKTRRKAAVVAVVAAAALVLAACGGKSNSSSNSGGEKVDQVKIAVVEDFSGAQSPLGTADADGVQQAIDEINAKGGIKSLGGAKLVMSKYDTQSTVDQGAPQTQKAIDDGANLIIGGEISDLVIAATNISQRAGVPFITTGGTAAAITQRGMNLVFQAVSNTDQTAQAYFDVMKYVAGKLNISGNPTMGLSISDTTYGHNLDNGFQKANSSKYFNIVNSATYPLSTTDLSPIAARMVNGDPQVLYNEGYPTDGLNFGKLFHDKFQTTAKIYLSTATYSVVISQLGQTANGMILSGGGAALTKGVPEQFATVNAKYKSNHNGTDMPNSAVQGYMEMMIAYQAFEKAGSTKGADVGKALHEVKLTHAQGNLWPIDTMSFGKDGALSKIFASYVQIQNGQAVTIWPDEYASASPIAFR